MQEIKGWKNTHELLVTNIKEFPDTTIAAAITRISNIMDMHDFVYSTFSGGKDSGVATAMLATVIELRRQVRYGELSLEEYNNIIKGSSTMESIYSDMDSALMTMDPEMAYSMTSDAYERMFKQYSGHYEIGDLSWVSENKEENPGCYTKEEIESMSTEEIQNLITGYGQKPIMQGFWMAFPIAWENMASDTEARYWSFDDRVQEQWTRPLPKGAYVWDQENFMEFPLQYGYPLTTDDDVTMGQTDQTLRTNFSKYLKRAIKFKSDNYKEQILNEVGDQAVVESKEDSWTWNGLTKGEVLAYLNRSENPSAAVLVAIRAAESFDRYTILKQGNYTTGYYGTQNGVRTHSPLMDMTNEDVYRFFSVFDLPINKAYERMYDAGIPLAKMRIGSLLNSHAGNSSSWLASLDPGTHAKVLGRINNLNFHNLYGGKASNSKYITIPQTEPFNEGMPKKVQQEAIELLGLEFLTVE